MPMRKCYLIGVALALCGCRGPMLFAGVEDVFASPQAASKMPPAPAPAPAPAPPPIPPAAPAVPPAQPVQALTAPPYQPITQTGHIPFNVTFGAPVSALPAGPMMPANPAPTPTPTPTQVPAQPVMAQPIQRVSYPGPIRNFVGNVGETLALAKKTKVVTYYDPSPPPVASPAPVIAPQAVMATPQTYRHRKCLEWFQP